MQERGGATSQARWEHALTSLFHAFHVQGIRERATTESEKRERVGLLVPRRPQSELRQGGVLAEKSETRPPANERTALAAAEIDRDRAESQDHGFPLSWRWHWLELKESLAETGYWLALGWCRESSDTIGVRVFLDSHWLLSPRPRTAIPGGVWSGGL